MKRFIIFLFCLTAGINATAQYNGGLWAYTWDISLPLGETSDFIDKPSFRGFNLRGSGFVTPNVALGGQFAWHTFFKEEAKVQSFDFETDEGQQITGDLAGKQFRYINSFPILFTAHWYSDNPVLNDFAWFGGLGVGTSIITRRVDVGIFSADDTKWHFTMAPEVGLVYGLSTSVKAYLSAQYFYSLEAGDEPSQSQLSFHIGLASTF